MRTVTSVIVCGCFDIYKNVYDSIFLVWLMLLHQI
jgi:hypothetical protein